MAPLLAVLGALALLGGATGTWVVDRDQREVGGLAIPEVTTTSGVEIAPLLVPLAVGALLLALTVATLRGRPRQLMGLLVAATGAVAVALTVVGALDATRSTGSLGGGPGFAGFGALAVTAAGLLASGRRAPAPLLDERYTVEGATADTDGDDDGEWDLASAEPRR